MFRWRRGELFWPGGKAIAWRRGLLGQTEVRKKPCMLSCHTFIFMRFGGAKRWGGRVQSHQMGE